MLYEFITINYAPLTGLLFLLIFLISVEETDQTIKKIFFSLWLLELVELLAYSAELWTASFTRPTYLRILLSAIGYSIRPFLLLGMFRLAIHKDSMKEKQMLLLSIPAFLNVIAAFSAFFTDIVYSYNDANEFVRGALGYTTHVVLIFYMICILVVYMKRGRNHVLLENAIIIGSVIVTMAAMIIEAVTPLHGIGRTAIVLSTIAYYIFFQTRTYQDDIRDYLEQAIRAQREHLREVNIIGVLANEYVTVCYVDVEKNLVTPYRTDKTIDERYGDILRSGVTFEQIFQTYVFQEICEEDRDFFLHVMDVPSMMSYLHEHGNLSRKYRVWRDDKILYCEMRVELVRNVEGEEDMVLGFSNNDTRVRREMVYQSTVQQEMDKVEAAKNSLAKIADLARQLQEEIADKLSAL